MEKVQSGSALTVPSLSVRNDTAKRRHLREKTVGPVKAVEGCRGSPRCSDLRSYFLIHHSLQVDERSERHPGQQPKVQLPFFFFFVAVSVACRVLPHTTTDPLHYKQCSKWKSPVTGLPIGLNSNNGSGAPSLVPSQGL